MAPPRPRGRTTIARRLVQRSLRRARRQPGGTADPDCRLADDRASTAAAASVVPIVRIWSAAAKTATWCCRRRRLARARGDHAPLAGRAHPRPRLQERRARAGRPITGRAPPARRRPRRDRLVRAAPGRPRRSLPARSSSMRHRFGTAHSHRSRAAATLALRQPAPPRARPASTIICRHPGPFRCRRRDRPASVAS